MKIIRLKMFVETINHTYQLQFVLDLKDVSGYEVEIEDNEIEKIHIYLRSGKERILASNTWEQQTLKNFLNELDNHFFPPVPSDDNDIKPKEIDFYYV